jgi:hypothetical protein
MPTFTGILDDTQIWQLALFVANADKLPDSAKKILAPEPPAAPAMPATAMLAGKAATGKK